EPLRVALLAGTLEFGGAEKQLVYMARALQEAGVRVRVYSLGANEANEAALHDVGIGPIGVGLAANPVLRLLTFVRAVRHFRPHIVQASTLYVHLYVPLTARLFRSLALAPIPCPVRLDFHDPPRCGPLPLRAPRRTAPSSRA